MGLGFSVKLAPGVRVRASSRGVRTSIGPRAARVHVGAGRTGFSTGAGPVSYYTSVRPANGSSRPSGSRTGTATANRQLAAATRAADKAEEAHRLADALQTITGLHRAEFAPARRPSAPEPPAVDETAIRRKHTKQARAATSIFARRARKAALAQAERRSEAEITAIRHANLEQHDLWQASLDAEWKALQDNDPEAVLAALAAAFEDNEAAAAAVGAANTEVALVVVVPPTDAIPDRRPTTTSAGNLSLKRLTKREAADLYRLLVCGHVLATVKEAFAVAPGIQSTRIVALRASEPDAYGRARPEVLLAARFERASLCGIRWADADASRVVNDAHSQLISSQRGATQELHPLDLTHHPDLAALAQVIYFDKPFPT
jgi:hypothetical protein